ncbi:hypothetical protein ASC66_01315 [Leifsonia sp. Root4]|uniref:hypothetical protein n=1 Tax=Leifsonia sp. Root4 TaxID=1736525 RepID=UPI0006F296C2|nr:hypothetical protein [Leifsonia sp. Root4]KQW07668.1 hypothetical protein ASC66_01315 [Leifsonia sp. Root4]
MTHAAPNKTPLWYPNQRVLRTTVQAIVGLIPTFVAILLILADQWPAQWLIAAAGVGVSVQAALAKIMALPAVDAWLTENTGIGSAPRARGL